MLAIALHSFDSFSHAALLRLHALIMSSDSESNLRKFFFLLSNVPGNEYLEKDLLGIRGQAAWVRVSLMALYLMATSLELGLVSNIESDLEFQSAQRSHLWLIKVRQSSLHRQLTRQEYERM
jgi:hypothetical protein